MSSNPDGTATCDRCGQSAGNGGVTDALVLVDVNFTTGAPMSYHLCRTVGRLNNDGVRCCDTALDHIPAAANYPHIGPSTQDSGTG